MEFIVVVLKVHTINAEGSLPSINLALKIHPRRILLLTYKMEIKIFRIVEEEDEILRIKEEEGSGTIVKNRVNCVTSMGIQF